MKSIAHRSGHAEGVGSAWVEIGTLARGIVEATARLQAGVLYLLLFAFALAILYPLFWMLVASLKTNIELFANVWGLPLNPQWSNWVEAWRYGVGRFFLNSIIVTAASIAGVVVVSAWAAYALARFDFPFRTTIFFFIVGGMMLSPQVALIPLFRLMTRLHLYNTYGALIVLDVAFRIPFTVFLMRAYMLGLPRELEESAYMDGANHWQVFWSVVIPLSLPIVVSAALLQALFSWNEFLFALTFIQDQALKTLPVGLLDIMDRERTNWPVLLAGLCIAALPMVVLFISTQRRFVRGLAEGWGKG
ncbi:MAG TPA: carbohydrate ABC transporter permease [bacterium]|nr:carbohydrate ABC transporter permease [bacterium]